MVTVKVAIFTLFCCWKTFKNMLNLTECCRNKAIAISRVVCENSQKQFSYGMTRCKDAIDLSFTPFFTPLVTPNITPWLPILTSLVRVVYATFVMHKTTVYKQKYTT